MAHPFHLNINRLITILAGLLCITACSGRSIQNPVPAVLRLQSGSSDIHGEISRLADPLIKSRKNVGMVVGIISPNQKEAIYAYGLSNLKEQVPMTTQHAFAIGSVTKSMLISLLRILDHKGMINLDDPLGDYLPGEFKCKDEKVRQITLLQLASHRSGLPREPLILTGLGRFINYLFTGENLYSHLTPKTIYEFLQNVSLSEPDAEPTYSNIGVGLLGHVLTLKTGKSIEQLLTEYVFLPLHMADTTLKPDEGYREKIATGYAGDQPYFISRNTPQKNWQFGPMMIGTGGGYSTANDLLQLLKAYLGISKTPLDEVLGHHVGKPPLGWDHTVLEEYQTQIFYFHGMIAGFNCYMGFEPESRSAVVVLQNNFNWVDKVGQNLLLTFSKRYRAIKNNW